MDSKLIRDFIHYKITDDQKKQLIPIKFHLKNGDAKEYLGVVAEQLFLAEPSLIKKTIQGVLDVDYARLSVVLLSYIKELEDRIVVLENNQKLKGKK